MMGTDDVFLYRYSDVGEFLLAPKLPNPTPDERFSWRVHVTNGRLETQHISFSADPNVPLFYALTNRDVASFSACFASTRFPLSLLDNEDLGIHDCNNRKVWENLRSFDQAAGMYASAHAEVVVDTVPFTAGLQKSLREYAVQDLGNTATFTEVDKDRPAERLGAFGLRKEDLARLKRVPKYWEFLALLEGACARRAVAREYGELLESLYGCTLGDMVASLETFLGRKSLPDGSLLQRTHALLKTVREVISSTPDGPVRSPVDAHNAWPSSADNLWAYPQGPQQHAALSQSYSAPAYRTQRSGPHPDSQRGRYNNHHQRYPTKQHSAPQGYPSYPQFKGPPPNSWGSGQASPLHGGDLPWYYSPVSTPSPINSQAPWSAQHLHLSPSQTVYSPGPASSPTVAQAPWSGGNMNAHQHYRAAGLLDNPSSQAYSAARAALLNAPNGQGGMPRREYGGSDLPALSANFEKLALQTYASNH